MTLHVEQRHMDMIHRILAPYECRFYAFGSRVTGKNKAFSDLDIFFFENISSADIVKLEAAFEESDLPFKVDIIDFKKCDHLFQGIMLKNYVCLKK